jgi:hypothetical protein
VDDSLGIRMDSRKAEGMRFAMKLITPDNGEKFIVELENATTTNDANDFHGHDRHQFLIRSPGSRPFGTRRCGHSRLGSRQPRS